MRRDRRIRVDLLSGTAAALILLGAFFLAGGVAGCFLADGIQGDAGRSLREYLNAYFSTLQEARTCSSFWSVAWTRFRFPLFLVVLGVTPLGVAGIPVIFTVQGFLFSYSVACFFHLFGWSGALPALMLFGLPALLWAPAQFILGSQGLCVSYDILLHSFGQGKRVSQTHRPYWLRCLLCGCGLLLCVMLEYWVLPMLIRGSAFVL